MLVGFAIVAINDLGHIKYLGHDSNSGGYPYWSTYIGSATLYQTDEEARRVLDGPDFTNHSVMSDGAVFPPVMIHSAAEVNNARPVGYLSIAVRPVELGITTYQLRVLAEIKRP